MKPQRAWTNQEVEILVQMIEDGKSGPEIAAVLGRTRDAVAGKATFLGLAIKRTGGTRVIDADPRALASDELRESILDAFVRFANDTGLSMAEVQSRLLGPEPARRPDSHYFGTSSIMRLAA